MRPEQPPGWTPMRRRRSSRPSCSSRLLTFCAATSVSTTPCDGVEVSVPEVSVLGWVVLVSVMNASSLLDGAVLSGPAGSTAGARDVFPCAPAPPAYVVLGQDSVRPGAGDPAGTCRQRTGG